jgi:hypothetical protein
MQSQSAIVWLANGDYIHSSWHKLQLETDSMETCIETPAPKNRQKHSKVQMFYIEGQQQLCNCSRHAGDSFFGTLQYQESKNTSLR